LLVFDCHEAWVYQLCWLDQPMDVVVGLRGREVSEWDSAMRPEPPNARIVRLEEVLAAGELYDCIVAHNLSDLLDVKSLVGPRLLILHETLDGLALEQSTTTSAAELRDAVAQYVALSRGHVISVSELKARSWDLRDWVAFAADPVDYPPPSGDLAVGLRVANQIHAKRRTLLWDFHEAVFADIPITLIGRNNGMPGVRPARDWEDLKEILRRHRFYIHTAHPQLEDGYNMATLEAMAAGLPILGNRHPASPITHGLNGFLSDDPAELRSFALWLLRDRELASRMGREARTTVGEKFSPAKFTEGLRRAIVTAQQKWLARSASVN
jgi:glycosyltransferase involved in cell wall biosynthesis